MFKLRILLIFYLNCVYCYKQQQSNSDYGKSQHQSLHPIPKPKAIIHLPENVYTHKITDTITLDHNHLSNYLSSINYIPDTIHKHAQLLAQLNPDEIKKYGQSIGPNQLPLISLTVPDKNSDYSHAQQTKMDEYSSQQDYVPQKNSGYQQQQDGQEYNQPQLQNYNQQPAQQQQQQEYTTQPKQEYSTQPKQEYTAPQPSSPMKLQKNCNQNKKQSYGQQPSDYQQDGGKDYGGNNVGEYERGSNENHSGYDNENKTPDVEYQQPQNENNYESGNSYHSGNNGGGSYENQSGGNSGNYENQQDTYSGNNNQNYGSGYSNEENDYSSENYESSPFDFNFVQDILKHVMQQLEQLQIDPDNLNAYGKIEQPQPNDDGNYESNDGGNQQGDYEVQGGREGIQLVDKPDGREISYGYRINHGSNYESQPINEQSNGYEPNGYASASSASSSQTTSYTASSNNPAIILNNKPNNAHKGQSTVTYRMPTINLELPKSQIEQIMKTISGKKGKYSQPIMIKANQFKLPTNLNLGKIKTIAFVKSSKLNKLNQLPGYFNSQLLGSNLNSLNSLNSFKIVSPMPSKKEETKYDDNPVLSAYGYGVSLPSSKLYASSSKKKSIILPLKNPTKRLGHSYPSSLQTASSNLKPSIISALPKLSKIKLSTTSAGSVKQEIKK